MKFKKRYLIIAMIFVLGLQVFVYGMSMPNGNIKEMFFSTESLEVSQGENVELKLNLKLIEFDEFNFTLTSNINSENLTTNEENIEVSNEHNGLKISANKKDLNIDTISLYYKVPEDIAIGTKIEIKGLLEEIKSENVEESEAAEENKTIETEIVVNEATKEEITEETTSTSQEIILELTVVEKEEEEIQTNPNLNQGLENENQSSNNRPTQSNMSSIKVSATSQMGASTQTNTYNGESNNYLKTLEITNINLKPNFSKTNTTYFVEVDSSTTSIDINAEAEDDNAEVRIYGNTELKTGENKILISVTAENGEVKTYRIYVTKK